MGQILGQELYLFYTMQSVAWEKKLDRFDFPESGSLRMTTDTTGQHLKLSEHTAAHVLT
jgi:hypothetical protein